MFLRTSVMMISDDGSKMSWVDHILCSTSVDKVLKDVVILNNNKINNK